MTEQEWHDECQANYEKVARSLIDDGYIRSKRTDIYKEQFTIDNKIFVITRRLASPHWWVKELI